MVQNMETYHEGSYRCSRIGHADRCPDAPRERGPNVPGEFLIRVERLLIDDKPDQRPKVSGRAYRDEPASSVTDIGLTMVSAGRARSPQPSRRWSIRMFQTRRFPNELALQVPHLELSSSPARDTSPGARN